MGECWLCGIFTHEFRLVNMVNNGWLWTCEECDDVLLSGEHFKEFGVIGAYRHRGTI